MIKLGKKNVEEANTIQVEKKQAETIKVFKIVNKEVIELEGYLNIQDAYDNLEVEKVELAPLPKIDATRTPEPAIPDLPEENSDENTTETQIIVEGQKSE